MLESYGSRRLSAARFIVKLVWRASSPLVSKSLFAKIVQNYWRKNPEANLQEFLRHEKSIEGLQGDKPSVASFYKPTKEGLHGGNLLIL